MKQNTNLGHGLFTQQKQNLLATSFSCRQVFVQCTEYLGVKYVCEKNPKVVKSGCFDPVGSYGKLPQFKGLNSKCRLVSDAGGSRRSSVWAGGGWDRDTVWVKRGSAQGQTSPCGENVPSQPAWSFQAGKIRPTEGETLPKKR